MDRAENLINLLSFNGVRARMKTIAASRGFRALSRPVLMPCVAVLLTLGAMPALCSPSQGTIAVTSGAAAPGKSITVSWTLINTTSASVTGPIVYYLNAVPLTSLSPSGNVTLAAQAHTSNSFTFLPVPGLNKITVSLLDTSHLPVGIGFKPPLLQFSTVGEPPKSLSNSGTPPVAIQGVAFPATVTMSIYVSGQVIAKTGLTVAQRKQILSDYAPLLLYSYDGGDEGYAPINAVPYVEASSLQSQVSGVEGIANSTLASAPRDALNPGGSTTTRDGSITGSASPLGFYLNPSDAAQKGAAWPAVMQSNATQNVGLYGHVTLLDLDKISENDPAMPTASLRARYQCPASGTCAAQVIKIEYWQLFGYSHDSKNFSALADHQGDWCSVQLYVDASWWQSSRPDWAILYVFHYLHGNQIGFDMGLADADTVNTVVPARAAGDTRPTYLAHEFHGPDYGDPVEFYSSKVAPPLPPAAASQLFDAQNNTVQLATESSAAAAPAPQPGEITIGHLLPALITSYQHPVVYVEWGGHEFWPTSGWSYYGASNHNGLGRYSYFGSLPVDVSSVATSLPDLPNVQEVLPFAQDDIALVAEFAGYWGAPQSLNGPPPGPPLHCEWYWDPNTTSGPLLTAMQNGEWADPSLEQDGQIGGKCGGGRPF